MTKNEKLLNKIVEGVELPESAYTKAKDRYHDLGDWLGREGSTCENNDPHVFSQGSFRLGTAIRPLSENEEYDLDLACNLREGINAATHSQRDLKILIGSELELYRIARNIKAPLDEKHRCWRLDYADNLSFHMDIVPCIPEEETNRHLLQVSMESYGLNESLAKEAADLAVGITDNRLPHYKIKPSDWQISNPEGYARWFQERMQITQGKIMALEKAQVDEIPLYKQKTPLQRAIQILKRHRDQMFKDNTDSKPISVIITTISGNNYSGSNNLESTLNEILAGLNQFMNSGEDILPNPVNPKENFADRWSMPQYSHLRLKENFHMWVKAVTRDFDSIKSSTELEFISEAASIKFAVNINNEEYFSRAD